jgi:23S rRNA (guanosine2251-2'-O)-methyltransferase
MKPPRRPSSDSGRPKPPAGKPVGTRPGRHAPDRHGGPRPSTPRPPTERAPDPRPKAPPPPPERAPAAAAPREDTTLRARPQPDNPRAPLRPRPESRPPAGPREAPGNSLWIYGTHAVAAALANPARHLRRLVLTEEGEAAIGTHLRRPWPLAVERVERARLDYLLGAGAIHQGAAVLVDPLAPPALATALARPGPVLVLDQVSDPRNIGAILRAAAAFGVAAVITQDRNAPEETGALAKAASGALETVPFLRAVNIARTLVALRAAGFWVIGLDAGGGPLSGAALAQRRVALVLGSEGDGLRRLTRETCDETASIAMPGLEKSGATALLDSLNVATAAAVALYELARR